MRIRAGTAAIVASVCVVLYYRMAIRQNGLNSVLAFAASALAATEPAIAFGCAATTTQLKSERPYAMRVVSEAVRARSGL